MTPQVQDLPVDRITPNPDQPRQQFDEAALQELAASILEHGILQPLIVYHDDAHGYVLIAGERRLRAAQLAGLSDVPCLVQPHPSAQQSLELALIENVQRENLSPAEEARAYQQLHEVHHLTDEQIGQRVGKARPTVTATRNLAKLPEAVLTQIGDAEGQLPKRSARQLLPLAQAVQPEQLTKIAGEIAALTPDDGRDADDVIYQALEDHAQRLPRKGDGWDLAWPGKPLEFTPQGGTPFMVPACKGCPSFLTVKTGYRGGDYCTNATCFEAKTELFAQKELARVSKKFNIPVATAEETVYTLGMNYVTAGTTREWLETPPAHLRLIPAEQAEGNRYDYHHSQLLGSPVVALASVMPDPFKADAEKRYAREQAAAAGQPESEADRKKRIAAEEREGKAKRAERGAVRRARADVAWLGVHTAEVVAPQIQASGSTLEFLHMFVCDQARSSGNWPGVHQALDAKEEALEKAKGKEREKLLKECIVLQLLYHTVPNYSNDWETDWQDVAQSVMDTVTLNAEEGTTGLGLKLPAGWDKPPIHRTESNCWHCGRFTPNEQITQVDRADGWTTASHGSGKEGMTLDDVCCPDCTKEKRAAVEAEAMKSRKNIAKQNDEVRRKVLQSVGEAKAARKAAANKVKLATKPSPRGKTAKR